LEKNKRIKESEKNSVEAETLGIGHGSRRLKDSSRRVRVTRALSLIQAVMTVEDLLYV
jgi:hypothetical protein